MTENRLEEIKESKLAKLPEFNLQYLFDDLEDPTEVTIFTFKGADIATRWMTAELDDTVPLEEIA